MMRSTQGRSTRGAARISAVWLITVLVLFFAALAFGFVAYGDRASAIENTNKAAASEAHAQEVAGTARQELRELSKLVGWRDDTGANPVTKSEALLPDFELLKSTFPGTEKATDLEGLVQPMIAALRSAQAEAATQKAEAQRMQSELQTARATQKDLDSQNRNALADLQQSKDTEIDSLQRRIDDLEQRLGQANAQVSQLDQRLRSQESEAADKLKLKEDEVGQMRNQVSSLAQKLDFTLPSKRDMPDGSVLQVSDALGIGFIDIGANQRLVPGLRFRVESGTPGSSRLKAKAEVLSVTATQAKVSFYDVVDRYDPVSQGDVVINELFDPTGERSAVLAGRFDGKYNQKDLIPMLERIGIKVYGEDQLDRTIDFLIVGNELWTDPETGDALEEPLPVSELDVFKRAESMNITILPLKRVREFLVL